MAAYANVTLIALHFLYMVTTCGWAACELNMLPAWHHMVTLIQSGIEEFLQPVQLESYKKIEGKFKNWPGPLFFH